MTTPMSDDNHAKWVSFWFLNGGGIHRAEKDRDVGELRRLAMTLPKLAWDESRKATMIEMEDEIKSLRAELDRLRAVVGSIPSKGDMLICADHMDEYSNPKSAVANVARWLRKLAEAKHD